MQLARVGARLFPAWPGWERGVTGFKSRERDITQKEESQYEADHRRAQV